jgi:PAS domain S-box-containing protein
LGKDKWYDLWRFYHTDGSPISLTDYPTEIALNHGHSVQGREGIIERKDGTRIPVISYPTPLRDETGAIVGVVNMTVDISGRKEAELALAERTMQLALAAKAARVGSFAYDIDTERMQISAGYAAIHGFPDGTTEIARSEWQLGVHPEDRVRWEALRSCAYRKRWEEYSGEYRIVRSGGEIRWIEARIFVSYDGDGRPRRAVGVDIDATERKRTEALLSESKALLADAMAAGHVMAFDWDAVTGLTQRSDNADDVLGSDQDQLAGSPRNTFLSHMHPDDRTSLKKCIRTLRPSKPSYALTFRFVRPDGRLVWLEETARGEFDATGKLLRVRGLTRDITDRKRAEHALAERNAQLALAGKVALVGSYAYDVNADSMRVSKGYAAIHGLPEGTTETTRSEWRSRVHPEDIGRLQGLRRRAFRDRVGEYNIEYRIVSPDRGLRWIESRSFISYNADGCPQRVIGVNIDVTERKRAEERQRVLVAELDHRVKNALATVSSVISQTGVGSRSVANFVASLDGRIRSMATTHELLSSGRWNGISLTELVRGELAPYATRNNTEIFGPEVTLKPEAGQAMAMVLHELATNAAKYGALSTNEGRVSIRWDRWPNGHPPRLVLEWQEIDGPPLVAPGKISFGTSTIRDLIPYEFDGTVDLAFAPAGVQCRLELSADWLINNGELLSETEPGADATQARRAKAPARRPGVFP